MTTPNGRQQEPTSSKTAARTPRGPLAGLRVLDLTWVLSGPYAAMTLCDLGAEVIKVERPPYGDIARTTGPFLGEESAYFISINRGKGSVSLDLRSPEGKEVCSGVQLSNPTGDNRGQALDHLIPEEHLVNVAHVQGVDEPAQI
jgi:hypothetical protein